jgi:tetratricopeptide (TPR) repeat protein
VKALVSGSASVGVVFGRSEMLLATGEPSRPFRPGTDLPRLFAGAIDVRELTVTRETDAQDALDAAWRADRALRLTLMLLDPVEPDEDLAEIAECLEDLLADDKALETVDRALAARPLSDLGNMSRAARYAVGHAKLNVLIGEVQSRQNETEMVAKAFDGVWVDAFPEGQSPREVRWDLVQAGAFSELSRALKTNGSLSFLKLQLISRHPTLREVLARWTASLQPDLARAPRQKTVPVADERDWLDYDDEPGEAGYQVLAEVRERQRDIRSALRNLDIDRARDLTAALIDHQRPVSNPDQIAKSLCYLAQQAKAEEVTVLQLEWAKWATEENPVDPRTFAHLADAYSKLRRFDEAQAALDKMEEVGDSVYPAICRARILKSLGRTVEARAAFLKASVDLADLDGISFASAGAAECLRDLGKTEEAIAEYRAVVAKWPLEQTFLNGLASALMDGGRFDEAIATFGRSANIANTPITKNGRATAARLSGKHAEALSLYADVLKVYPNNSIALTGQADALRIAGRYQEALASFDEAIRRVPEAPHPWAGKISLLNQLGRRAEALEIAANAISRFPTDHHFRVSRARIYKALGRIEEALQELDLATSQAPDEPDAAVLRAEVLYLRGENEAAHAILDRIIEEKQHVSAAVTSKAALLIVEGELEAAGSLLGNSPPRTQWDWSRYLLKGQILAKKDHRAAFRHLSQGLRSCPFARQKALLRNALVALELNQGRWKQARALAESAEADMSNVVQLHVFAANHRPGRARAVLNQIRDSEVSGEVIQLAEEIARRHRLVEEKPLHSQGWIYAMHRRAIVLEAVA